MQLEVGGTYIACQSGYSDRLLGTQWRPSDVRAFIEGPWVAALKALAAEGKRLYTLELGHAEARRRDEELAELQVRFGIAVDQGAEPPCNPEVDERPKTTAVATATNIESVERQEGQLCSWLKRFFRKLLKAADT